mmetsp:Transcript_6240/g.13022  ORF Transcript_6240/g.13022 Transcript_6240/m.13022 type:complete len:97 (-) Transcript_6240:7-297(-)
MRSCAPCERQYLAVFVKVVIMIMFDMLSAVILFQLFLITTSWVKYFFLAVESSLQLNLAYTLKTTARGVRYYPRFILTMAYEIVFVTDQKKMFDIV